MVAGLSISLFFSVVFISEIPETDQAKKMQKEVTSVISKSSFKDTPYLSILILNCYSTSINLFYL